MDRSAGGSRAGRNLKAAVPVGLGLLALVALSLAFRPEFFVALAIVAVLIADHELARAFAAHAIAVPYAPLAVGSIGMLVSAWTLGAAGLVVALVLTVATVFVWRVLEGGGPSAVRDAAAGIFTATYVPFLAGFAVLTAHLERGPLLIAVFVLLVVGNDLGGYVAGVLWGAHRIAPSISPKKSWEGFAGSVVLTTAVAFGSLAVLRLPLWGALPLGILVVLTSTAGDFAESMLKRDLGLKDFGTILPGHGGMMDRLDSLLVTAPVVYLVFSVIV